VTLHDGTTCGALHCRNRTPLARRDRQFLELLAKFVAQAVDELRTADSRRGEHVRSIVDATLISAALQPIIDLETGTVSGMEALARFPSDPRGGPDLVLAEAEMAGLGNELELLAFQAAGERVRDVPDDVFLAVNVSPSLVLTPAFAALLGTLPLDRIVVEITEHSRIDDYAAIRFALSRARLEGLRLAIDDAGAGFASFNHILALAPDIIKLDVSLIQGVDRDPNRRSLVTSMLNFGRQIGTEIIAEGIETEPELATLRELGVRYGQGFLLGRPTAAVGHATELDVVN
jgi:EAL domain-containing protein (putative c-di-GMP-specific phosphodiesterase class I)